MVSTELKYREADIIDCLVKLELCQVNVGYFPSLTDKLNDVTLQNNLPQVPSTLRFEVLDQLVVRVVNEDIESRAVIIVT